MDENDESDENLDILEDIKALEQALLQGDISDNESPKNESAEININYAEDSKEFIRASLRNPEQISEPDAAEEDEFTDINDVVNVAYQHNLKLISLLKSAAADISAQLEACLKRQQEVDYQIQLICQGGRANWKIHYKKAGMPYFKDKQSFSAPINADSRKKLANGELLIPRFRRPTRWTTKDRNTLKIAVRAQAANEALDRMIKESAASSQANGSVSECEPPKDLLTMVGPLGAKEFDWMRISNIDLKGRHTPHECRVIWNILLHPAINSQKWTNDEDMYLKMISKAHRYENWDSIAKKLGTNRSAYICFIRYNTLFGVSSETLWTPAENKLLMKCIEKLRFGNYLPWGHISMYISNRTKNQVYSRWKYNLDPCVKKGRFTEDEDELLLESVSKMGADFPKISAEVMPHRTSVQLSGRFRLLMLKTNESYNSWTITEDRKLLQLYDEFGTQWSMIASIMKRDRTYLRHRYSIIKRHMTKGIDLTRIPRKSVYEKIMAQRIQEGNNSLLNEYEISDCYDREVGHLIKKQCINESDLSADAQLLRYFQSIQAPAVKPGRKATYHTADELEVNTNKLYHVFDKLDVKFDIPDELDNYNITVKDKEVLQSLKNMYANKEIMSAKTIEKYRRKMFGDSYLNENEERFIPPAPFGLFQGRVSKLKTGKINMMNNRNHDLELDFIDGLETPENIEKVLTQEENRNFEKLSSLISKKCRDTGFLGRFEQAYIPSENTDDIYVEKLRLLDKKNSDDFDKYDSEMLKLKSINNNISLKPCYSTLLGYQNLLIMKEAVNNEKVVDDEVVLNEMTLTHRGRMAFHLFKSRLFRLIKYPIVMAKISPDCHIKRIPTTNLLSFKKGTENIGACASESDVSMEIDDPDNSGEDENMDTDGLDNIQDTSNEEILPEMMCDVKYRVSFDE